MAAPLGPVTLAFYASSSCDPSGHGEGAALLGAIDRVVTNASENFVVDLPVELPLGTVITATATRNGSTSEFSACAVVGDGTILRNGFE